MQIPAIGMLGKAMQGPVEADPMKLGGLGLPVDVARAKSGGGASRAGRDEFSDFLTKAVSEVEEKMRISDVERQKVLTGEANNLHQATIAAQEASVAFSLMVEVRNKLVESYQELMRMQV